ncbi:MAG: nucleotide exchange factor GrpE [Verrucomicrobiae bacterium]|nr:nucleotide exchange factor GrpE [Verrucomicrobiae bacterium]MDW8343400.1 nucleotide exchange factor GrpE [Verrucomicrobiae bacterium]
MTQPQPNPIDPTTPAPAAETAQVAETAAAPETAAAAELDTWKQQAAENWDRYLRALADLDNYRKRARREREEAILAAREEVIRALLPALDNLERALEHSAPGTPLHEGLEQVKKQFARALADFGLVEIVPQPGDLFDHNAHEAIGHEPHPQFPENTVVALSQSGYRLGERLLRPARVVVSAGSAPAPSP